MDANSLGANSQAFTGMSILIAGKNTFGYTSDDTKNPEFEFQEINGDSTGIVKTVKMTVGVENLGHEYIEHMANGEPFVLKGNINEGSENKPFMATIQGQLHKISNPLKVGDNAKRVFELRLDMYNQQVDGKNTIEYSRHPYRFKLAGKDMAPNFNDNI